MNILESALDRAKARRKLLDLGAIGRRIGRRGYRQVRSCRGRRVGHERRRVWKRRERGSRRFGPRRRGRDGMYVWRLRAGCASTSSVEGRRSMRKKRWCEGSTSGLLEIQSRDEAGSRGRAIGRTTRIGGAHECGLNWGHRWPGCFVEAITFWSHVVEGGRRGEWLQCSDIGRKC